MSPLAMHALGALSYLVAVVLSLAALAALTGAGEPCRPMWARVGAGLCALALTLGAAGMLAFAVSCFA